MAKPEKVEKKVRKDYSSLTGPEKAAILMLSLPEEQTSGIFSKLDPEEIRELSLTMMALGSVTAELVENTFVEFVNQISSTGSLVGSLESTERLLLKALTPDQAESIMEEIRGPAGRTLWDKLGNVNNEVLASYLKSEYPQTIAVVLSRIKAENAARVLALLPDQMSMDVVERMLKIETVRKEIVDDIENTLRTEFMSNLSRTNKRDQHEMVADIFNFLDRASEARFLNTLDETNIDSAERIRALMFTFDDLTQIDTSGVQVLIRNVDKAKLAMALKGANTQLKTLFFGNMTERASKLLQEEMKMLGAVKLREVEEAQNNIVGVAKDLANAGDIAIANDNDNDDELVE